jgi:hypothetical protein
MLVPHRWPIRPRGGICCRNSSSRPWPAPCRPPPPSRQPKLRHRPKPGQGGHQQRRQETGHPARTCQAESGQQQSRGKSGLKQDSGQPLDADRVDQAIGLTLHFFDIDQAFLFQRLRAAWAV